jgi:hypothetical protein
VVSPAPAQPHSRTRRDLALVGAITVWFTVALELDVGVGIWPQRALGVVTWLIFLALLRGEAWTERAQVAVWAEHDPTGVVSIGNPPSGIAGGYCVFDAVALACGPAALRAIDIVRRAGILTPGRWCKLRPFGRVLSGSAELA